MLDPTQIPKARLEAFSDGVIAILITIMVLEMKVPHDNNLDSLKPVFPVFLSYMLSYVYLGIYWNNHHHLLHAARHINGKIMWANLHLLFWLSLIPFVTGWLGENGGAMPTAFYGGVLFMAGLAYTILQNLLIKHHGQESLLAAALQKDWKGQASILIYLIAIGLAFVQEWIADLLYIFVACLWFVPDQRIEQATKKFNLE